MDDGVLAVLTTIIVYGSLAAAIALGFVMRQRRGWIALGGIVLGLAMWAVMSVTGAFEDDREGTAHLLTLIYGVPIYAAAWAAAVGVGYVGQRLRDRLTRG
jgi:hypothetical protein